MTQAGRAGGAVGEHGLELWAGAECTVNRVGERYYDQLARSGHADRLDDFDRLAALGARAVRVALPWERVAPDGITAAGLARADWRWADARMNRVRSLGLRAIVGLVHHGSGPRDTNLVDPRWPTQLAAYAAAVAVRYPWVEEWTPVNEPLTTARFSCLYGVWYPHARDPRAFGAALVGQLQGVRLAMAAVRAVRPGAQLVQTEDLGKCYATSALRDQAEFENARRWLTFDLLCGRPVDERMRSYLVREAGVAPGALDDFEAAPCPPDVLGINHYLTSERFLDHRVERYPAHSHGGNTRERYADVEAVRVRAEGAAGPAQLLAEAWLRYARPLAVTEAHLGCTREQQLRWLVEIWNGAAQLRAAGGDVRAVTLWSAFGAYDWSSLLTRDDGTYEPGAFDVRAPAPRATALARVAATLAAAGGSSTTDTDALAHPALDTPGWWREPARLAYPSVSARDDAAGDAALRLLARAPVRRARSIDARPLLITGATGTLGRAVARACDARGLAYRLFSRAELDIGRAEHADRAIGDCGAWAVVNCAGYVRVDDAERERDPCWRANADGAALLAAACADREIALVSLSTDLVFDGLRRTTPYTEFDVPSPLGVYGASKAEAERRVLDAHGGALVVRTSAFFGPWDEHNFAAAVLRDLTAGRRFVAADDAVVSPTYVPHLADALLDLLIDGETGLWHLTSGEALTWAAFARRIATAAGLDPALVCGMPVASSGLAAQRPRYSALATERGHVMPPLENAICHYLAHRAPLLGSAADDACPSHALADERHEQHAVVAGAGD